MSVFRHLNFDWHIYPFEGVHSFLVSSLEIAEMLSWDSVGKCLKTPKVPDYPKVGEGDYAEGGYVSHSDHDHHIAPGETTL